MDFCNFWKIGVLFHPSVCGYPIFPALFIEKWYFLNMYFYHLCQKSVVCRYVALLLGSLLCSVGLCVWELVSIFSMSVKVRVKLSGPGSSFAGTVFITDSILLLVISVFTFYISSWFNLDKVNVSRDFPFLLGYQICWHIVAHNNL